MTIRPRRNPTGTLRALGVALLLASCTRAQTEPPSPPPADNAPPPADVATHDQTGGEAPEACRNWSDLDVGSLPPLPATPYTETFEKVWLTVLTKHFDPTLSCQDWPALRIEYGQKLVEAKDEAEAFAVMTTLLEQLGHSHLGLIPPRTEVTGEPRAAIEASDGRLPMQVRVVGGTAVVVDGSHGKHRSGVPGGAELLAVGEHEVGPMVERLGKEHQRQVEATFAIRRVINSWLHCPKGERQVVRYQAVGAGKPKTKKVACRAIEAERITLGNLKNVPVMVEHRMIEGTTIGYLHFNVWMIPLMEKIEAGIAELRRQGMTALVIDLRGNPGGVGAMVVPLGRLLLSEATNLGVMHMREGKQTFNVAKGEDPFTGEVALLVDEGTASTSEIFAQALKDLGRAKVYGAVTSQGAALPSVIEQLPGGAILQYVVADYQSPKGIAVEGKGVAPDALIPETAQDFAQGHDPVLDAAIADLRGT